MNILHLSAVKNWGGGENHIENLCYELTKSNPEVSNTILCIRNKKFHQRLQETDLNFETASLSTNFDPFYILKLIRLSKKKKIDLIHIHDPRAMALAILADRFYNLPPFIFSKKISFPVKRRKQTIYKYNYPKIKKHLCVSNQTREIMSESIVDKSRLTTIYHGTRLDNKTTSTPFLLSKKFNIQPYQFVIGSIANHHRAKKLEILIEVANYLINQKRRKEFFFIQIGSFTDRTPPLQQKIKELNLENHFKFLGYIPNASNFIPQFDASLITSTNEGFPQFIYESFYHKIPVVTTNVAGIPEIVKNYETGFLADMDNYQQLSDHILFLKDNLDLKKKITEFSHKLLIENFTTTKMAEQTLAEYKKVLDGRS